MIEHNRPKFEKGDVIKTRSDSPIWMAEVLDVGSNTYLLKMIKSVTLIDSNDIRTMDLEIVDFFCVKIISPSKIWKKLITHFLLIIRRI